MVSCSRCGRYYDSSTDSNTLCFSCRNKVDTISANVVKIEDGTILLRQLLWLNHGCDLKYLYGDDGEMQCTKCKIDFKRFSAQEIEDNLTGSNIKDSKPVSS